jgi:MoaA/NifB/PqqE/SkfB family radical SAM enzyme
MYNINEIKTIHLEVTSRCQASCPMCSRNLQGGVTNPFITETQISLEQFSSWFSKDFVKQLDRLYMCGNLGDPVIAQDTLEIFKYLRNNNNNINLTMHTNGSARTVEWWQELARTGVTVTFGIDGLADTHKLYRIGTDWHKIIENARAFIQADGHAEWHMLIFKHNEHQVEECRTISEDMGFKRFASKNSSRFREDGMPVIDKLGRTTHKIYPTEKSKKLSDKVYKLNEISVKTTITCKVAQEKSLYVSATGNVSPCCWTDMEWMLPTSFARIDYMDKINTFYNLNNKSLEDIFSTDYFKTITNTWDSDSPLLACSKNCGTVDRLNEQFK